MDWIWLKMGKKPSTQNKKKNTGAEPLILNEKESANNVVKIKDSDESLLGMGESFNYRSATIKRKVVSGLPAVNPFLKSTVMDVMVAMYDKKQSYPKIKEKPKRESIILSGMLIGEFVGALDQIVPDNYLPKGKNKRNLKKEKPTTWKRFAINEPSIRDKLKRFVADGDVLVFKVDKNRFMYCLTKTFMKLETYIGSIWHMLQVRQHLFQTAQWVDKSDKKGMRHWFVPNPFFEGTLIDLELILENQDEAKIWACWDKDEKGFNPKVIKDLIVSTLKQKEIEKSET